MYAKDSSANSRFCSFERALIALQIFVTHSSGEVAGISFIRRKASNILSSGILLDVMAFSCNKKDIFTPFLVMGLRYLFVPTRMDELICVVNPMDANAVVPVM